MIGQTTSIHPLKDDQDQSNSHVKKRELLLLFSLVVLILMSSWGVLSHIKSAIKTDIGKTLKSSLETSHVSIRNQFDRQKKSVKVWAKSEQIRAAVLELQKLPVQSGALINSQAQGNLRDWISSLIRTVGFRGFFVIGKDNINLASSRNINVGFPSIIDEKLLNRVWRGETIISVPQQSDVPLIDVRGKIVSGLATMFVATPVEDQNGKIIAILTFQLDPDESFSPVFERSRFGDTGESYAFNKQGFLISDSHFNDSLREMGLISGEHSDLIVQLRDPMVDLTLGGKSPLPLDRQPLTRLAKSATAGNAGSYVDGYRDYRGVPVVGAWLWDDELGFGFASEIDFSEAFASFHQIRLVIIIFSILSIITLVGLALVFFRGRKDIAEHVKQLDFQKFALDEHAIVSIANARGAITYANKKFCDVSGYTLEELIGQNHRIVKSDIHPPEFYQDIWKTISRGEVWQGEIQNKDKNGKGYWVMTTIVPFLNERGKAFQYISIRTDITERKEAEIETMAANRAKSDLMANMSHELRTPLNAIIGFSSSMKQQIFGPIANEKYEEYLNDIYHSGEHLLELINDILDVSAIEAGALELDEENVSLIQIVDSTMRIIKPRADAGQVVIYSSISPDMPLIYIDQRRIKQVLLNLLSNAVKFTPEAGEVTLSAWVNVNGSLAVSVADTGIGMDEEEITKALSTFGQVDSGLDRKHEGTGLGLPLTKGLMERHGGSLEIKSKKDHGTLITVTFPKQRVGLD
ncbi:MAG: PAS domain-containing protein [Rhodospirillaceae bacterium]|nr:PAS domain-containing protein [Rhodospirillaceae bacterium]MBT5244856.1 PAS domain-containing protein [Rhodospirillaceae bacterium]MBT5562234.1 PAS domain-containing protein [Rhodospirillaceae bacterium]MBT6242407.1 PAS domain-containing protein [Rhodospirillaceae bacterium]MBT7138902.1 PAS domain-containing protein [Rhodospirillaceae bacterium]